MTSVEVKLIAHTIFPEENAKDFFGYIPQWDYQDAEHRPDLWPGWDDGTLPTSADELGEFAGRNCYQAWGRPNPATADNKGYLQNILEQGHESVLEHASVTVAVKGVSTALLGQLTRHRHLSFSVLSKRYVDESGSKSVVHPDWTQRVTRTSSPRCNGIMRRLSTCTPLSWKIS
jgi:thymidylate synthase (FAD)